MKQTKKLLSMILAAIMLMGTLCITVSADATPISVTVADDTYIHFVNQSDDYSTQTTLSSRNLDATGTKYRQEMLLRWDLTGVVTEGMEIDTAKLKVYQVASPLGSAAATVYSINNTDYPTNATWSTFGSSPITTSGAAIASFTTLASEGWVEIDVSNYFKSITTDKGKHVFSLFYDTVGNYVYSISSMEGTNPASLEITLKEIDQTAPVVIGASSDTYVNAQNTDNYIASNELMTNNVATNYFREAYVEFDLSTLTIPEGYKIDTVTFSANASSAYCTATTVNMYTIPADTDFAEIHGGDYPSKGEIVGLGTIAPNVAGAQVDIDITEYIKSLSPFGTISFAIQGASGSLYLTSKEGGGSVSGPRITITFVDASQAATEQKLSVKNIAAFALIYAAKDESYTSIGNNNGYYSLQTRGHDLTDENNRFVMASFDISAVDIPEGMVIKSAMLSANFSANYCEREVVLEAIGMSNTSFDEETTWNNKPEIDGGRVGHTTIPSPATGYVAMDITPYFTSCYYGEKDELAVALQLADIYIRNNSSSGSANMSASLKPYIELVYGAPDTNITFGTTAIYQNRYNTPKTQAEGISAGKIIVEVPVTYCSDRAETFDVYLAAYGEESGRLLWLGKEEVSVIAANGEGVTAAFETPYFSEDYTWKAFVWDKGTVKNLNSAASIGAPQE